MISTYVKKQLLIFSILALSATLVIVFVYAHIPTVLGYGQMTVTGYFKDGSGIYVNSNVTSRGVGIGKVSKVSLTPQGVAVVMSVKSDTKVGADARAEIHSVSAVGEQYVDLISEQPGGPYLRPDAVIPIERTTVPEQIAPVLDKVSTLLGSIPNDGLQTFLNDGEKAFANLGPDLRTLLDSSQNLIDSADQNYGQTERLITTVGPLLDTQNVSASSVKGYFSNLADFTGVLRQQDGPLRGAIHNLGPAADQVTDFLSDNENGAPILAHNLRIVGQVFGVYRPGVEQVLVDYPVAEARLQTAVSHSTRGLDVTLRGQAYEGCTTGFHSENLRNPNDLTDKDAVPNTYCKVPHNDPRVARGARNIPCLEGHVGMRAATIDECFGRRPDQTAGSSSQNPTLPVPDLPTGPQRTPLDPPDNQVHYPHPPDSGNSDPLSQLGGVSTPAPAKEDTWQSLFTAPMDR
jgi:phospholipid/cholesterol/gamma-HCH transport system substrate-binding protein